jgi:hypothetical protein
VKLLELVGAQLAFVIHGVYQQHPANHLIVADNKEEAAYWQNDLAALFGQKPVHFFPDSFKQPLRFEELNQTNVLERTETINAVSNASRGQIIVTYPEALFERVVSPEVLSKSRIEIAKGEKLDPEFLMQVLIEYKFTREEQDQFAIDSYERSAKAWQDGKFNDEIAPVTISTRKGDIVISEDEEYKNVKFDKIPELKPVFQKDGTVTAANASTINDGAAALILVSGEKLKELGLTPLAKLVSAADAEQAPEWFTTTPSLALPLAAKRANLEVSDLDYIELNEAFAVVGLANMKIMNLDASKVNVNGGAVSLGHPLGASGARIIVTLINVLKQNQGKFGGAGICNGGGGASAMIIENI